MQDFSVLLLVAHAASQLSYQWLSPSLLLDDRRVEEFCRTNLATVGDVNRLSLREWLEVVTEVAQLFADLYPQSVLVNPLSSRGQQLADNIYRHLVACQQVDGRVIVYGDVLYPYRLQAIADPPLALTVWGDLSLLQMSKIAVIGSRRASPRSLHESFSLGRVLVEKGYTVVSGGAYGCDIAAHRGALSSKIVPIPAIVVFAGGLGQLYPRGNSLVFEQLQQLGALFVSERLWHSGARAADFPIRNRIISGLCQQVIVMEAGECSGAMLTARLALTQDREVWVLRHADNDVRATGSNNLIADGANSFVNVEQWEMAGVDCH